MTPKIPQKYNFSGPSGPIFDFSGPLGPIFHVSGPFSLEPLRTGPLLFDTVSITTGMEGVALDDEAGKPCLAIFRSFLFSLSAAPSHAVDNSSRVAGRAFSGSMSDKSSNSMLLMDSGVSKPWSMRMSRPPTWRHRFPPSAWRRPRRCSGLGSLGPWLWVVF